VSAAKSRYCLMTALSPPPPCAVIPAGYYLKAPGQVAACPMGEWKGGVGGAANCSRCPFGVTTGAIATREAKDCAGEQRLGPAWGQGLGLQP
jgi:hypothetical protein